MSFVAREGSPCADAGTQFCPCSLAPLGECLSCSILRGEMFCNCSWSGVCVYSNYIWSGMKAAGARSETSVEVESSTTVGESVLLLTIGCDQDLVRDLGEPGSFVFLRPATSRQCFNAPISVMEAKAGRVRFAVQVLGPKTKALAGCDGRLVLTGPFFNGLFGRRRVRSIYNSRVLVVAKGIGQGPAVNVVAWLARNNNSVTVALGPGDIGATFAESFILEYGASTVVMPREPDRNRARIADFLAHGCFDLVVSCGPDVQHRMILECIRETGVPTRLAATNNAIMCCGEGICGSCSISGNTGVEVRACKSSAYPEDLFV